MTLNLISRVTQGKERPRMPFKPGTMLTEHMRIVSNESVDGKTVMEFIGTGNFDKAWFERQRYEVDAGRDEEPILYTPIYSVTEDPSLPRNVPIFRLGPAGVIFDEITEGGEVKFATVGQSNISVPIKHYAFGLEYTKDLVIYNELWSLADIERQAGTAFNALLNHIHLAPIINGTYAAANQTAASSVGTTLAEKYLRTLEDAITASATDQTNPRRGPYVLLMSTSNFFTMERALSAVPQQGFTLQSSAISRVSSLIAYDGWTGVRGKKSVTYPGVTANKAYLIDTGFRARNFKSFVKQGLQRTNGNEDVSRFILEQSVWDTYFGVFADVTAAVEEITLPTS
jgi:hypothetical protein